MLTWFSPTAPLTRTILSARETGRDVPRGVHCGERLAGGRRDQPVPAQRLARAEHLLAEERACLAPADKPARDPVERRPELRCDEVPVEIRVVVDRRAGDVDLRGPVGLVA